MVCFKHMSVIVSHRSREYHWAVRCDERGSTTTIIIHTEAAAAAVEEHE
jgi:hypothetical protein